MLIIVQCKRYKPSLKVGPSDVRDLRGTMAREKVNLGFLVTTSTFTAGARQEAEAVRKQRIKLINGAQLATAAKQIGLPGEIMF